MATEVTIPALGESVTEGTITAWLVEVGDTVSADQPLFELSSDKIDTEVPSPAAGVLKEIKVGVDETVDVGTVVAIIGDEGEAGGEEPAGDEEPAEEPAAEEPEEPATEAAEEPAAEEPAAEEPAAEEPEAQEPEAEDGGEAEAERQEEVADTGTDAAESDEPTEEPAEERAADGDGNGQAGGDVLMSPIVRRMVSEAGLDVSAIEGSGEGGRITREDVEAAIAAQAGEGGEDQATEPPTAKEGQAKAAQPATAAKEPAPPAKAAPKTTDGGPRPRSEVRDLPRIRQRIAAKMMESLQSSAQLTTVQEADVTRVMRLRERVKEEFERREGVSLSPFAFLARAAVLASRNHPAVNASADWDKGKVTYRESVNLGIAVDTEKGLIVPNVKDADSLTLAGLARAILSAANRARGVEKLEMADLEGGTFTITNTGSRGVLLDTPILNYPEVAILATGAIVKRPVVVEVEEADSIAIRAMVYLCLTYDHRLLDGADAARFVTDVKQVLETHDWDAEIGY